MERYNRLLENNHRWISDKLNLDADYFLRQAEGQTPSFLWVGCSDSRVMPDQITGTKSGEMFVYRNIANLVSESDLSMMSVLEFAIQTLEVDHIILCGHTRCGGVLKAFEPLNNNSYTDRWIESIRDLKAQHEEELSGLDNDQARWNRLVELNVEVQTRRLAESPFIQQRWRGEGFPIIHGWVYHIEDGSLQEILHLTSES